MSEGNLIALHDVPEELAREITVLAPPLPSWLEGEDAVAQERWLACSQLAGLLSIALGIHDPEAARLWAWHASRALNENPRVTM